jgi:hypothetical protein
VRLARELTAITGESVEAAVAHFALTGIEPALKD